MYHLVPTLPPPPATLLFNFLSAYFLKSEAPTLLPFLFLLQGFLKYSYRFKSAGGLIFGTVRGVL
jgi:hypothetical protein